MARYYFCFSSAYETQNDTDGFDLADESAARAHALALAGNLLRHAPSQKSWEDWSIRVLDEAGNEVFTKALAEVAASRAKRPQIR